MGGEGGRKVGSKSFNHSSKNRQFCCADVTDECLVSRKKKKRMLETGQHNPDLQKVLEIEL